MSLFNSYSDSNKLVTRERNTRYTCVPTMYSASSDQMQVALYYTATRVSSEAYQYLGMSKSAADACVAAMREKYTRQYAKWTATEIEQAGSLPLVAINEIYETRCSASITETPTAGDDWNVTVEVEDSDEVISRTELTSIDDFESFFQLADARDGSASGGSLAITAAKWNSAASEITVNYSAYITNFSPANLTAEEKSGNLWAAIPAYYITSTTTGTMKITSTANKTFRLKYMASAEATPVYSKAWTTNDYSTPSFSILRGSFSFDEPVSARQNVYYTFDISTSMPPASAKAKSCYKISIDKGDGYESYEPYTIEEIDDGYRITVYEQISDLNNHPAPSPSDGISVGIRYLGYCDVSASLEDIAPSTWVEVDGSPTVIMRETATDVVINMKTNIFTEMLSTSSITVHFAESGSSRSRSDHAMTTSQIVATTDGWRIFATSNAIIHNQATAPYTGTAYGSKFVSGKIYIVIKANEVDYYSSYVSATKTQNVIKLNLASTGAGDTVEFYGDTTAATYTSFDWEWDADNIERAITNTPTSGHAYSEVGLRTIKIYGDIVTLGEKWASEKESVLSEKLGTVTLPTTVTTLGDECFSQCEVLSSIDAPGVTTVGDQCFLCEDASALSSVQLPEATTIGDEAFKLCTALESLRLPKVESIGENAFLNGYSNMDLYLDGKTMAEAQAMTNFPWGMHPGSWVKCSDGDIEVVAPVA